MKFNIKRTNLYFFIISLLVYSCNVQRNELQNNWGLIENSELPNNEYLEIFIDENSIHTFINESGLIPSLVYELRADSVFLMNGQRTEELLFTYNIDNDTLILKNENIYLKYIKITKYPLLQELVNSKINENDYRLGFHKRSKGYK